MKKIILFLSVFLLFTCKNFNISSDSPKESEAPSEEIFEFGIPVSEFEVKDGTIKRGQFFTSLMTDLGLNSADIYSLTQASRNKFDLKKIRVGNPYKAYYTLGENPKLAYLVYKNDKASYITFGVHDSIFVKVDEIAVTVKTKIGEATINSSLWNDTKAAGMSPMLAIKMSEIFAWTIDFFGLQKGDSFKVIYDEISVGNETDIGTIHAVFFSHAGSVYDAYRFVQDETPQYWNSKGENLRKAFLKAPLSFTRVSSGFTYSRRHPVTRIVRPHTGVDYAAPKGTEVMSIGDGVVIQKGYSGGGGNTVKIRHNSTYTTAYLHLSAYSKGLSKGKRVRQGEVIGYVGSTGLSTGPHLDFRVWKEGTPINPLKMEAPPADPIKNENREAFMTQAKAVKFQVDSLKSVQYLDTMLLKLGKR
jgi:murein DD-endopeptidase MepM/ murein hydrolase activator NlpD